MHGIEDLYRRMLLIRRFEERLVELHDSDELPGIYHVYIGQEAVGVAVTAHTAPDDVLYTTHRNHGHLLARGADPARMFAEILGREGGYCRGRGGSLHLAAPDLNIPVTSAMVGGSVVHAVGAALSRSRLKPGSIAVSFFGDGACEEGAIYEAFNLASIWSLPILFVCENNGAQEDQGIAGAMPTVLSRAERLTDLPAAFAIPSIQLDGRDLAPLIERCGELIEEIRGGGGPRFIETRTIRWPGGRRYWPELVAGPTEVGWLTGEERSPEALGTWTEAGDPLRRAFVVAEASGQLETIRVHALDASVRQQLDVALEWARASPYPPTPEAFDAVPVGQGA